MNPTAAALALVPGLENGTAALHIEALPGGSVNQTWRVDTGAGRFVLRIDGAQWRRPGVDRERELALHTCAAAAGLAPRIVRAAPADAALVTEFIDGRGWTPADYEQPPQLARLGERLARLHALPVPAGAWHFDPLALARDYLQRAASRSVAGATAVPAALTAQVLAALAAAVACVEQAAGASCIIHGDLVHGNLLAARQLWLLDWEYAQVADPCYDVASVLASYPAAARHAGSLAAAAGLCGGGLTERLAAATYVYRALNWAWHQARGEAGVGPGSWP